MTDPELSGAKLRDPDKTTDAHVHWSGKPHVGDSSTSCGVEGTGRRGRGRSDGCFCTFDMGAKMTDTTRFFLHTCVRGIHSLKKQS